MARLKVRPVVVQGKCQFLAFSDSVSPWPRWGRPTSTSVRCNPSYTPSKAIHLFPCAEKPRPGETTRKGDGLGSGGQHSVRSCTARLMHRQAWSTSLGKAVT